MERMGLVAQLEAALERSISLGLLPQDGKLPSERTLASQYGISRSTAREALVRLRARGLVEVHPGRRARAVLMEQEVRLENLGAALRGEGPSHPERLLLLAGYLELKREATVELLAACCEKASEEELERVQSACFLLGDAVCWELKRPRWLALEFELLRQAARVAQRPGHWMLIQTLERACRDMAGRVEPYLDSAAIYGWTQFAMEALCSRDVKALRSRLPGLLQASDERVLQALAPTCEAHGVASFLGALRQAPEVEAEAYPTQTQVPEVSAPAAPPLTASQVPVANKLAEAPLTSTQAPEMGPSATGPMQAGGGQARFARTGPEAIPLCAKCCPGALRPRLLPRSPAPLPARGGTGRAPQRRTLRTGNSSSSRQGREEHP